LDYTSAKLKLTQSWRYKTLAAIKRHKNHLTLSLTSLAPLPPGCALGINTRTVGADQDYKYSKLAFRSEFLLVLVKHVRYRSLVSGTDLLLLFIAQRLRAVLERKPTLFDLSG